MDFVALLALVDPSLVSSYRIGVGLPIGLLVIEASSSSFDRMDFVDHFVVRPLASSLSSGRMDFVDLFVVTPLVTSSYRMDFVPSLPRTFVPLAAS